MKLTKNFTLEEFINSPTAKRYGINNSPDDTQLFYIEILANQMQIIRDAYGKPIVVDSGFRCEKLNKKVGGVKNSDHKYGAACDFHSVSDSLEDNMELWNVIMRLYKENALNLR